MQKRIHWITAFIIILSLVLAGCGGGQAPGAENQEPTLEPITANLLVTAEGKVIPVQSANLSYTVNGVVAEILVEEGQAVAEGQVIARLDGSERLVAALKAAELEMISAQQAFDDLNDDAILDKAAAQLRLAEAQKKLDDAIKKRASRDFTWGDREQVDIAYANYILAQESVEDLEEAFSLVADRSEDSVERAAALSQLAAARQTRDKALANYNYLVSKPDTLEVNEAEGNLAVAKAEVEAAKREYELVKDGPNPEKLALAKARLDNAKAQLASAQSGLDDLELKAPFGGVVVSSNLKVGEQTGPAAVAVTLADASEFKVETTDLTERDVIKIKQGDPVIVTFDAIPDLTINGKVERVKTLGENKQGDITYTVLVKLDEQDDLLRWNMTSFVTFNP